MQAIIITIGDEILNGTTVDTNSAFISIELNKLGIDVKEKISISDKKVDILFHLKKYLSKYPLVLITGGLGPTNDDITKNTLAKFFKSKLIFNEKAFQIIQNLFEKRGVTITEKNRQQAMLPHNCIGIENTMGTAPGMWFELQGTSFISMPGVPYEMKEMLLVNILPVIKKKFKLPVIIHRHIMTSGMGESWISDQIEEIENNLPSSVTLAYLPSAASVKLRLTARGKNNELLSQQLVEIEKRICKTLGNCVYGIDGLSPEQHIGNLLIKLSATVSTAESCTGGKIAQRITSVQGSSKYFIGSIISYSNSIKVSHLGVKPETLEKYGAVSKQCVDEMLTGVLASLGTDYAIAVSGIAGPGNQSTHKPVGLIYIGVAGPSEQRIEKYHFLKNREQNIEYAVAYSFHLLRQMLESHIKKHVID